MPNYDYQVVPGKDEQRYCCSKDCVKTVLIFLNLLVFLCGGAVCGLGIWLLISRTHYVAVLSGQIFFLGHFLLTICGGLVMLFSIMGFLAIFRSSVLLLSIYTFFLLLLLLGEILVAILAFIFTTSMAARMSVSMRETMIEKYGMKNEVDITRAVDTMQREQKCCGSLSYRDWYINKHRDPLIPASCCRTIEPGCSNITHPSNIYHNGCSEIVARKMHLNFLTVAMTAAAICIVLAVNICLGFSLIHSLKTIKLEARKRYQR